MTLWPLRRRSDVTMRKEPAISQIKLKLESLVINHWPQILAILANLANRANWVTESHLILSYVIIIQQPDHHSAA